MFSKTALIFNIARNSRIPTSYMVSKHKPKAPKALFDDHMLSRSYFNHEQMRREAEDNARELEQYRVRRDRERERMRLYKRFADTRRELMLSKHASKYPIARKDVAKSTSEVDMETLLTLPIILGICALILIDDLQQQKSRIKTNIKSTTKESNILFLLLIIIILCGR